MIKLTSREMARLVRRYLPGIESESASPASESANMTVAAVAPASPSLTKSDGDVIGLLRQWGELRGRSDSRARLLLARLRELLPPLPRVPMTPLSWAAADAISMDVQATEIVGLDVDPEECHLHVEELERDGSWCTLYCCFVPPYEELEYECEVEWWLRFPPEIEGSIVTNLSKEWGWSIEMLHAMRQALGATDWDRVLDEVVPHRRGRFGPEEQVLSCTLPGRLPGRPTARALRFSFVRR